MAKGKKKPIRKMMKAGGKPGGSAPSGSEYGQGGFGGGKVMDRGKRAAGGRPWPVPSKA